MIQTNDEEKLLIKKALSKMNASSDRSVITSTGFLNEREQMILEENILPYPGNLALFYGGFDESIRKMMIFMPDYYSIDDDNPISAIRVSYYKEYTLTHRDFLGSILGLGVQREMIGDILVDSEHNTCDILVKNEIKDFLLINLTKAGRATLETKEIPLDYLHIPVQKTEIHSDTVASPRFDAIVSSGFNISRENASNLIKAGKVYLNRLICNQPDKLITNEALINCPGHGKFNVYIDGGLSKKGRLYIKIKKYI